MASARKARESGALWTAVETNASDSGWALKLKQVSEQATESLHTHVQSARLVEVYSPIDRDMARFELETEQGPVHAILSRSGEYSFFWKH